MARPLRIEYPGAWYHVMNRGRRKEVVFRDDADYRTFLNVLGRCFDLFELQTHAYSCMPNHFHLLVRTPRGNLSRAMRQLDGVFTQKMNLKYHFDGSLFRGRFKSILVEEETYLLELVRYIHRNPFKAKLEKKLGEHPWTSHRAYLNERDAMNWLQRGPILSYFGKHRNVAKRAFHAFVSGAPSEDFEALEKRLDGIKWPALLGTDRFKEWVKQTYLGPLLRERNIPQLKEAAKSMKPEELIRLTCQVADCRENDLRKIRRGIENPARRAYIYLAREYLKLTPKEIARPLGNISAQAIGRQHRIACDEIENKSGCHRQIQQLADKVKFQIKT